MRRATPILAVLLAACSAPPPPADHTVTGRHGPLVYIVMSEAAPRSAHAWRLAVRDACGKAHICNAKIWTDPTRAAQGFPMTELEANAIQAAYLINRATGADEYLCHPFGPVTQRCAK